MFSHFPDRGRMPRKQPQQTPRSLDGPPKPITGAALARLLEMTPQAVGQWKQGGCPTTDGKHYRVAHVVKWLRQRERESVEETLLGGEARERWEEARAQKTQHEADLAGLELAKAKGELVTIDDVMRETGHMLEGLRAGLLGFTTKYSHLLVGCKTIAEVQVRLEPAVHALMQSLADGTPTADDYQTQSEAA